MENRNNLIIKQVIQVSYNPKMFQLTRDCKNTSILMDCHDIQRIILVKKKNLMDALGQKPIMTY